MEIVHDGPLTASCRKNPWLIRQAEWAVRSADSCQGPIAFGRNTINLQVPDGTDAPHGLTVVWLRPGEFGKPGGSRLLIDKYVCSWMWLPLVGS